MSERTSSVLVGAFIVGAMVILVAAGLFFAGSGFGGKRSKFVMVFDGSLRGLTIGAPLALRGVTIGQVTDIDLLLDASLGEVTMAVVAEVDETSMQLNGSAVEAITTDLVTQGLRAQLNTQSLLTGLLYVQLEFHPETEGKLTDLKSPYPQIPTIPTELEQLRESLESIDYATIAEDVNRIAEGIDSLINNPDMQALPGSLRSSLGAVETASAALSTTLATNSAQLSAVLSESRATFASINQEIPQLSESIGASLAHLDAALQSASQTMASLEEAAAADSPPRRQLSQAMHELTLAARAVRSLARSLEEHPEALLRGRSGVSE